MNSLCTQFHVKDKTLKPVSNSIVRYWNASKNAVHRVCGIQTLNWLLFSMNKESAVRNA